MTKTNELGGVFTFPGTDMTVNRMGYGAMQLAGPQVFGPPRDRAEAIAVVREAVESGVNHIDTSDFYGPHVVNEILREALHPYPAGLTLVTKVGAKRGPNAEWIQSLDRELLVQSVEDNLRNLGVDALDVVNLRGSGLMTPDGSSMVGGMEVLAELQQQGKIRHIGLSNVSREQFVEARKVAPVVTVQNFYNVANRADDAFIDELAAEGIAYVPFFPLGGFSPLQSGTLNEVAAEVGATPMQVALARLLQRSPNILLIPGTSTRVHLRENLAAAALRLSDDLLVKLDDVAKDAVRAEFHLATASAH
ncbi:oxidoreductase [Occallatibacter riparius]|uniref:Oxidoreductase n=1 Tax=Occallatibacter riparius TaxID=1002689 RepID=A0A9J7BU42_9BACT|nr:oxidoreductase [Occallatibacter riparius]UWZ86167.1 oxidoreductase [Occallatibacter riparius]